jgi:hypothetical protein
MVYVGTGDILVSLIVTMGLVARSGPVVSSPAYTSTTKVSGPSVSLSAAVDSVQVQTPLPKFIVPGTGPKSPSVISPVIPLVFQK